MKSIALDPRNGPNPAAKNAGNVYILALYIPSLALAAAVVALFVYEILSGEGFVPDREAGVAITRVVAAGYVAVQLAYLAFVRLLLPTRDYAPMMVESAGQLSACALLPYLLEMEIAWPIEALERYAMLVYFAAFVVLHAAGKLVSFFAYTSGKPSGRWEAIAWAVLAFFAGNYAFDGFGEWRATVDNIRPTIVADRQPMRAGGVQLNGIAIDEGSVITRTFDHTAQHSLTFRFARTSVPGPDRYSGDRIHVITYLEGDETERVVEQIALKDTGWTEYRIPSDAVPENLRELRMWWSTRQESPFQRILGVNPVVLSSRQVLLSGPDLYIERAAITRPNLVFITIDGLGLANMSLSDADLKTTPNLDRIASADAYQWFASAYTPAPDPDAAAFALLTGRHPIERRQGSEVGHVLKPFEQARFAVATFGGDEQLPEGDVWVDENANSVGDLFSEIRQWIDVRQELGFAMTVRIRDLAASRNMEEFQTMLRDVDREVSGFVRHIRDYETRDNTIIVIAGTHATKFDDEGLVSKSDLMDEDLQVPLIFYVPGATRESREDLVSLEDVAPTIYALVDVLSAAPRDGRPFWNGPNGREPIAMDGSRYTLRTNEWRYIVDTASNESPELYDITRWGSRRGPRNIANRFGSVVRRQQATIEEFLNDHGIASVTPVESNN